MSTKFTAKDVVVLRFSNKMDRMGVITPPDCYVEIPSPSLPVKFNHEGKPVGSAKIHRKGNKLLADIEIVSVMKDTLKALDLLRRLTPSLEVVVTDVSGQQVLGIRVMSLALINGENVDERILPLGEAVHCASRSTREGLH